MKTLAGYAIGALVILLALALGWNSITGWWKNRKIDRLQGRVAVAEQNVVTGEKSANVSDRAAVNFDNVIGGHRTASAEGLESINERIRVAPPAAVERDDPDILRRVSEARRRAQAAADSVQGTRPAEPDSDRAERRVR